MAKSKQQHDRNIDLLERLGAGLLYASTKLAQKDIAKILGMDNNRISEILKGIKKPIN